ncbi:hypothetical protein JTB14_009305 [Gonioctena quinquepunctata]|nr:hypothetical protein JTB14_009305 [Gonioctena quinquepunctata]
MGEPMHVRIDKRMSGHFVGVVTRGEEKKRRVDEMKSRIFLMKTDIEKLRCDLENEKKLLALEKMNIIERSSMRMDNRMSLSRMENYTNQPSAIQLNPTDPKYLSSGIQLKNRLTSVRLSKHHLDEIEQTCDNEMIKLQKYIDSIKHLRKYWKNINFDVNSKMAYKQNSLPAIKYS